VIAFSSEGLSYVSIYSHTHSMLWMCVGPHSADEHAESECQSSEKKQGIVS
jgi:hypothetical protein